MNSNNNKIKLKQIAQGIRTKICVNMLKYNIAFDYIIIGGLKKEKSKKKLKNHRTP